MNKESLIVNAINAVNIIQNKRIPIIDKMQINQTVNDNLMHLFESVVDYKSGSSFIGIEDNNGEILTSLNENNSLKLVSSFSRQNPNEIIEFRNNNLYAYLNRIDESFENDVADSNGIVKLFESIESLSKVRDMISVIVQLLANQNDFNSIHNDTALRVKTFNKSISVYGFNCFDILHINEFKDKNIHAIFYNINDDSIIIYCDGIVHSYYIKTDKLTDEIFNYYQGKFYQLSYTNDRKELYKNLNEFIRSELKCLYMDYSYFKMDDDKFNNVFNDERNTAIVKQHFKDKELQENAVKKDYANGYLVGGNIY